MWTPPVMPVTEVKVVLTETVPSGWVQLLVRMRPQDKRTVDYAARLLDMPTVRFTRMMIVQAARAIVAEVESK